MRPYVRMYSYIKTNGDGDPIGDASARATCLRSIVAALGRFRSSDIDGDVASNLELTSGGRHPEADRQYSFALNCGALFLFGAIAPVGDSDRDNDPAERAPLDQVSKCVCGIFKRERFGDDGLDSP
jgi:hypothetical protein